jgi:manganese transport protein
MQEKDDYSLSEVHASIIPKRKGWRRIFAFLGPAYLISVGYMDPGNWATDIAGGSQFGYALIWVLLMSNIMAIFLQGLSARLGIVRGRDLAQANREYFPRYINFALYLLAEIAIAACDLAELLGLSIGIKLLTGIPLIWGVVISVLDIFLLMLLQHMGMRKMEAFIISLVAIITVCFGIQIFMAGPETTDVIKGLQPHFPSEEALFIAIGIIGATVMPHNLYLHSALVQTRKIEKTDSGIRAAIRFNRIDSAVALNVAFLVNTAILVLAATTFFKTGHSHVGTIIEAHQLLPKFLGDTAPLLFAIALIAAGQSSTVTGTLAGQIIMEGYLRLRINPLLRRIITRMIAIIPAFLVIFMNGEDKVDYLLILSQVILSIQLGFAIIPLIHFVSDKEKMGIHAIKPIQKIGAWLITILIIYLNVRMIAAETGDLYTTISVSGKIILWLAGILLSALLLFITLFPLFRKGDMESDIHMHPSDHELGDITTPSFNKIAIALDFSEDDKKIIAHALAQGNPSSQYVLIHILESASARMSGHESADLEAMKDRERLDRYVQRLNSENIKATSELGFGNRKKEIVRIVKETGAEMLVMGAHRHKGIQDLIYGQTVNAVRHAVDIPVMVVNL